MSRLPYRLSNRHFFLHRRLSVFLISRSSNVTLTFLMRIFVLFISYPGIVHQRLVLFLIGSADFTWPKLIRGALSTNYLIIITSISDLHAAKSLIWLFLPMHIGIIILLILFPVFTDPVHRHGSLFLIIRGIWNSNSICKYVARSLEIDSMVRCDKLGDVFSDIVNFGQRFKQWDQLEEASIFWVIVPR